MLNRDQHPSRSGAAGASGAIRGDEAGQELDMPVIVPFC